MPEKRRKKRGRVSHIVTKEPKSRATRIKQWCLGSVLGLLLLSVLGNHISSVIPNLFQYIYSWYPKAHQIQKEKVWYAAGIQNKLKHRLAVAIWSDTEASWIGEGLESGETKWFSDTGPLYLSVQGDFILNRQPRFRLTHTYEGDEAYELETKTYDHKPTDDELKEIRPNKIGEILGGKLPKIVSFVDGTVIAFEVVGPTGINLHSVLPVVSEGQIVFPFQIPKDEAKKAIEK